MANAFETPIAANPISQFVELPLDFIDKSLQRKQDRHDKNKAELEDMDTLYSSINARSVDSKRKNEIVGEYETAFDQAIERVGGDYGRIGGELDVLKRKFKKSATSGELAAINKNYSAAQASTADLKELYGKGKIGYSGYQKGLRHASEGAATTLQDDGDYSTYSGYAASSEANPLQALEKSANDVVAQYSGDGSKVVSSERVRDNLIQKVTQNKALLQALQENYEASGSDEGFNQYLARVVSQVAQDKSYSENLKVTKGNEANDQFERMDVGRFQRPGSSDVKGLVGGSASMGKSFLEAIGFDDQFKTFDDWASSEKGKSEIAYMNEAAGKGNEMPSDPADAISWIEDQYAKNSNVMVSQNSISKGKRNQVVDSKGNLMTRGRIWDQEGNIVSPEDISGSTEGGHTASVTGTVEGGDYPYGSYVIVGKNGGVYIQEPMDEHTLTSPKYAASAIRGASQSPTGRKTIHLPRATSNNKGQIHMNQGDYEVQFIKGANAYKIFEPGTDKLVGVMNGSTGDIVLQK